MHLGRLATLAGAAKHYAVRWLVWILQLSVRRARALRAMQEVLVGGGSAGWRGWCCCTKACNLLSHHDCVQAWQTPECL